MKFLETLKFSISLYIKNPRIIIPSIFALIILYLFSLSSSLLTSFQLSKTISLILFAAMMLVLILVFSIVILTFISISLSIVKKSRLNIKNHLKKTHLLFLSTLITYLSMAILFYISFYSSYNIGLSLSLSEELSTIIYIIFTGISLILLMFLSFTPFIILNDNASLFASIRKSLRVARSNLITIILFGILILVISSIISYLPEFLSELISLIFLAPITFIFLAKVYLNK